jgi:D-alanyl-D-alanine carboxypeptidase
MRRRGSDTSARGRMVLVGLAVALAASACTSTEATLRNSSSGTTGTPAGSPGRPASGASAAQDPGSGGTSDPPASPSYAVKDPGPLTGPLRTADVLVTSSKPIPASVREKVAHTRGVAAVMPLSLASLSSNGRTLTLAAGDPGEFRRFTPVQSAQADDVWSRVAGGEVAVDAALPKKLEEPGSYLRLGTAKDAPEVHIGAYAPLVKQISAFVDVKRAEQLDMTRDNALLLSTGRFTPSAVTPRLKKVIGADATLQTLALEFNVDVPQTAVLSGGTVASAVGTFNYTPHADGRVTPDAGWVQRYIRTEQVPIIGSVTCNKVMLVQLRAALEEVVQRGLADRIHPSEYGGCYYPRYIAYDPGKGLSLHTWGIAIDLNVPENQRGTVGQMDRQVVAIFKKWGFAWGGDWRYTDPMHFELAALVTPG